MNNKTTHTILITYWLIKPELDLSDLPEMRTLGHLNVFEASFESGVQRMIAMHARFDADDPTACMAATRYAIQNAIRVHESTHGLVTTYGQKFFLDGEEIQFPFPEKIWKKI